MSEPFEFLDEEEPEDDEKGLAWLPLTLAGIALAGFLSIPILGLLKPNQATSDWSDFAQADAIEVNVASELDEGMLLTPSPEDSNIDLQSVDETLAGLGTDGVEVPAIKKIANKDTGSKRQISQRIPPVKKPIEKSVAAKTPTRDLTVKSGDTLYGISKKTGSTPDEIAELNGIKKDDPIRVGQTLKVPGSEPRKTRPVKEKPAIKTVKPAPRVVEPSYPSNPSHQDTPVAAQPRPPVNTQPNPALFPENDSPALPKEGNPLDKYNNAIAYRVQTMDNLNRIADAHATTPAELIELNGRSKVKKGEMIVVPVDNCMIKDD